MNEKCSPELLLIIQENCPVCAEVEKELKEEISDGTIRLVNVASEEGRKFEVRVVPEIVAVDCKGNFLGTIRTEKEI